MFLSRLLPNPRHREVRRDLARLYDLHRTLLRAFPDVTAGGPGRVLFRLDWPPDGSGPRVLVQSDKEPNWDNLPADYMTDTACKAIGDLALVPHQTLAFRLRANPTRRVGKSGEAHWVGKRVGLMQENDQLDWLRRKAAQGGFRILSATVAREDDAQACKTEHAMKFLVVCFDGILEVTDPVQFRESLTAGIGSGKAFGFGLLSIAPAG